MENIKPVENNTQEEMKANEEEMGFWKKPEEKKQPNTLEMGDDEINTMNLKAPKPIFTTPTTVKVLSVKLFKQEEPEIDRKKNTYIPFFMTIEFEQEGGQTFFETYRGGRLYDNEGQTKVYIGPNSALGKLKDVCLKSNLNIGNTVKTWASAIEGKTVTLQASQVMFQGKMYDKNYIIGILSQ